MDRSEEFADRNNSNREEMDILSEESPSGEDSGVCSTADTAAGQVTNLQDTEQAQDVNDPSRQQNYDTGPYDGNPYYNNTPHNHDAYQNTPYNNDSYHNNPYNNTRYGDSPYYDDPYRNAQYSPLARPAKNNNIPLIIGIAAAIVILFLIAVFALTYRVVSLYSERWEKSHKGFEEHEFNDDRQEKRQKNSEEEIESYDRDRFDDEYDHDGYFNYDEYDYDDYFNDDYFNDDYFNDGYFNDDYFNDGYFNDDYFKDGYYNDDFGDGYDYDNDQYYTLHDDIKKDLSYSVEFEHYEYDTDNDNVEIMVSYPVIKGEKVPNLKHLNSVIAEEIDLFKDYFEEEYADYMDEYNGYFSALSSGYVTYMDEEKMSIAFAEYIYTDYYNEAFLYSINIDMENGVILENENMLSIDDDFSVEFRKKSDVQNGEIVYLTGMTDQEITDHFNSSNIIVFYTPKGMEIGFNYEEGWVTVTYEDYDKYLKVF